MQRLVIVESPKKAQLIQGFLKDKKLDGYVVRASAGHVRDLKKKDFGIDIANNFTPSYEVSPDKKTLIRELRAEAKKADLVYLASDEDREGEAIAWHLYEALGLTPEKTKRIVFHEITSEAFMYALEHPREINYNLVDAQQARRVLDRIVGFELSPVLWRRIRPSLSAGRVQSVAVRLVVEREREINAFVSTSAFRVQAQFVTDGGQTLECELNHRFPTEAEATSFIEQCSGLDFTISDITRKAGRRSPAAPFTTSTLQQDAATRLGYSPAQTMRFAQSLYESGYITYMRTDSVNLSSLAMNTIAKEVVSHYGNDYHQARRYQTKSKGAQEAHEAIRPTYIDRTKIEGSAQEQRLYDLIRRRTMASQMSDAQIERSTALIAVVGSPYSFVAQGEVITFPGFLSLYMDTTEEGTAPAGGKLLPPLKEGETATLSKLTADERYTQRPPRYTEASMVSKMEELGIGRPSTYAPTIQTIQAREYVLKGDKEAQTRPVVYLTLQKSGIKREVKTENYGADKGKLIPTDMGLVVNDFLIAQFPNIVDYNFTAKVEEQFDQVAEGKLGWQSLMDSFYRGFHPAVLEASEYKEGDARIGSRILGEDPTTGAPVMVSIGRYGPMVQIAPLQEGEKPRYASLQPTQSIDTITLEEALKLFELPRVLGTFEDQELRVAVGRFGPYVLHNKKFYSLPKGTDPLALSQDEAIELIRQKRLEEERSLLKTFEEDATLEVRNGRFGAYLKYQGENYKLTKGTDVDSLTYEACMEIVAQTPTKKASKGSRSSVSRGTTKRTGSSVDTEATTTTKKTRKTSTKATTKKASPTKATSTKRTGKEA